MNIFYARALTPFEESILISNGYSSHNTHGHLIVLIPGP